MNKATIEDIDISGKKVLVRVDYNVPLTEDGNVSDNTRIKASLPLLNHLIENKASVILMSHLGRPKGQVNPKYSLKSVAFELSKLLTKEIKFIDDCVGENAQKAAEGMKAREVILLENLRFHPEEEKNDPAFAEKLASYGDIFVQEAFGTVHRAHASTVGVTKHLKAVAGFLVKKEIDYLSNALSSPKKPFLAILGGAKVSDKIGVIKNLLSKVDSIIIGGGMAYTFLKSQGKSIGKSLLEQEKIEEAASIFGEAASKKVQVFLPEDHVVAKEIKSGAEHKSTSGADIEDDYIGVDIGPATIKKIAPAIKGAKTIIWNGPMGVFEIDEFSKGTMAVAEMVVEATKGGTVSIIGGGDSVSALKKCGLSDKVSHISTGGGASLELLEGKELPGITALNEKE